jgi:hypothetical protein
MLARESTNPYTNHRMRRLLSGRSSRRSPEQWSSTRAGKRCDASIDTPPKEPHHAPTKGAEASECGRTHEMLRLSNAPKRSRPGRPLSAYPAAIIHPRKKWGNRLSSCQKGTLRIVCTRSHRARTAGSHVPLTIDVSTAEWNRPVEARDESDQKFTTTTPAIQQGVTRADQALSRMTRQGRPRQLERIAAAFASAVEAEEFERAAGWLAVAQWQAGQTEVVSTSTSGSALRGGRAHDGRTTGPGDVQNAAGSGHTR